MSYNGRKNLPYGVSGLDGMGYLNPAKVVGYGLPRWGKAQSAFVATSNWSSHDTGASAAYEAICYSSIYGGLVGTSSTGSGNRTVRTLDGVNWITGTSAADDFWMGICEATDTGTLISVGFASGGIQRSTDGGNSWTSVSSPVANAWTAVCYDKLHKVFIAVSSDGTGNRVMRSANDGITWTTQTSAADNDWRGVAASENGVVVAVSRTGTGNRVMYSSDGGINWATAVSAADNNWIDICWANRRNCFYAVSTNGTGNRVMKGSPDGITWATQTSAADLQWQGICYSPQFDLVAAVANSGTGNRIMTSSIDGSWISRTNPNDNSWTCVADFPEMGRIVALCNSGTPGTSSMASNSAFNFVYTP